MLYKDLLFKALTIQLLAKIMYSCLCIVGEKVDLRAVF